MMHRGIMERAATAGFLPPRPFLDAIVMRVLILWMFLRGVAAAGSSAMDIPFPASVVGRPIGTLWLIAVILLVVRVEMWRKSELVFLANLGFSFRRVTLMVLGECLILEVGLRVALA